MSMTKALFDELFPEMTNQPSERDLEEQYYWELARRQEIYLDFLQKYVESLPESFYFSEEFQKYINTSVSPSEKLMAGRKMPYPNTDMDFVIPPHIEDANHTKRNQALDENFF